MAQKELIFNGTVEQFETVIQGIFDNLDLTAGEHAFDLVRPHKAGASWIVNGFEIGSITAFLLPGNKTRLNFRGPIDRYEGINADYELIQGELEKTGWTLSELPITLDGNLTAKGKPGRPHNQNDIWAWEQVNKEKRNPADVYKEWEKRPDMEERNLQDPARQFKRISKPGFMTKS